MYLEHFGLRELPFQLTPDTDYFFGDVSHHEALNVLLVALRSGEGFLKITGEVGTGKTLLCRMLLNSLGEDFITAYIPNPMMNAVAMRMALADELQIDYPRNLGQHRLLKLINDRLIAHATAGRRVVLCVDEAQSMPRESMEALRLLSNLETEKDKLLHIVLFGQPELDERLAEPGIRQLRQRITFSYHLKPITRGDLSGYLNHRLVVAGGTGNRFFGEDATAEIYRRSKGIPRLINILSHKAMMAAFGRGDSRIQRSHVRAAAVDTFGAPRSWGRFWRFGLVGTLLLTAGWAIMMTPKLVDWIRLP